MPQEVTIPRTQVHSLSSEHVGADSKCGSPGPWLDSSRFRSFASDQLVDDGQDAILHPPYALRSRRRDRGVEAITPRNGREMSFNPQVTSVNRTPVRSVVMREKIHVPMDRVESPDSRPAAYRLPTMRS